MKKSIQPPIFRVLIFDLLLLNIINIVFVSGIKGYRYSHPNIGERYLLLLICLNLSWVVINLLITRYRMEINKSFSVEFRKIIKNTLYFISIVTIFAFAFKELFYSRVVIFGTYILFISTLILYHYLFYRFVQFWRFKKSIKKNVIIAGANSVALDLVEEMRKNNYQYYEIKGFIKDETDQNMIDDELILGTTEEINEILKLHKIDELFITLPSSRKEDICKLLNIADYYGVRVKMIPDFYKIFKRNIKIYTTSMIPVININEVPLDNYYYGNYKRFFDIIFSLGVLVFCCPIFLIIGLLIKTTSQGPIFYEPVRMGCNGRLFKMYKFRTMYNSDENREKKSTKKNDSRITPVGKYLRRYSFDELPQFINVLKGDMSVVGPRPHREYLNEVLQKSVSGYMMRHYIKPGITGWAQVNGWRGPTNEQIERENRTSCDLWYIENWSFGLDIKIIFLTIFGRKVRRNAF